MGIEHEEIAQPAYTCTVVAHASVLSGNTPVFVDCSLADYNMEYGLFEQALTARTRAVIPTHVFGYPMDTARVNAIVRKAEKRFGKRIYVIQDCAHSFEAESNGTSVIREGDGALFGLGISKQITSIFGGMFTTDDDEIAARLQAWRERHFQAADWLHNLKRLLYLLAVYPAFNETLYGLVYWLQEDTPLLNRLTKAYHLDEKIHFPPDYAIGMSAVEGSVGLVQLPKYARIQAARRAIAARYFRELRLPDAWVMPPQVRALPTRTSSFAYPTAGPPWGGRAPGRAARQLIEYSVPHLPPYAPYKASGNSPTPVLQRTHHQPAHPSRPERAAGEQDHPGGQSA
jgi:dTDP-4-amino-4,6-dideoxygalactose transaminase